MTDRITDEMVEAAAREFFRACFYEPDEIDQHQKRQSGGWLRTVFAARAALSAALPLMDGWIKIEGEPDTSKAPWDGGQYMLSTPVKGERVVDVAGWPKGWKGKWPTSYMATCDGNEPTHWMPLLPAPKGDE